MSNFDEYQQPIVAELVPERPIEFWPSPPPRRHQRRVWLPLFLFVATCLSTMWAGYFWAADRDHGTTAAILDALKYSAAIMTILLCHEMGHFIQAWRYGVYASLPYFLPMPLSPIGTFGAVIGMEPRRGDRRAVFDIGISGPLAGLIPTIIFCIIGLHWSTPSLAKPGPNEPILGSSMLFSFLIHNFVPQGGLGHYVNLHPFAMAGWVGLLITAINLISIGQLDGGHIIYGMLRSKAHWVGTFVLLAAIAAVVIHDLWNWWFMLFLLILLGTRHPPTADDNVPLGLFRHVLGWLTLAIAPLGFTPIPFDFR
jgi:membrane-associated protease RseP (regulator of RpoE activity)